MLKRVKIQGYKSLADVEVKLQPLSVLFGPNASGKSNFLDALQLLSRIATSNDLNDAFRPPYRGTVLESFTFEHDGIKKLLTQEKVSFSIEIDVELSQFLIDSVNRQIQNMVAMRVEDEANNTHAGSGESLVPDSYLRYRIEIEMLPKTGILRVAAEYLNILNANGELLNKALPLLERRGEVALLRNEKVPDHPVLWKSSLEESILPKFQYRNDYPYLTAMHQELAGWFFYYLEPREHMRIPDPVREVHQIGQMGEEVAAFLNTLQAINERQFKGVENALHMLIPSITGIDVSVNSLGNVELNFVEGEKPVSVHVISDGTLRVLGLLALSSSKERPTLLGIEEPENSIHPHRMSLIASLLETRARRHTQMIVTTHSPYLVDFIPRESLYVCRKLNGLTSIEPFSLWEYPDVNEALDDQEEELPELTVSERILRGDFDA